MKRIFTWLYCLWLRDRIEWWDDNLAIEKQRHADFPSRMRAWGAERQELVNRLERLERPAHVARVDWHRNSRGSL